MSEPDWSGDRPDPRSFGGFIARAVEKGGMKAGVREAEKLLGTYEDRDLRKAAEDMPQKVKTAILKMVMLRQTP